MAYLPELEPGENLVLETAFKVSEKSAPFNFAISDRAIYWPATKVFAVHDATYFKRLRKAEVAEVSVRRLPPYAFWLVAILLVLAGLVTAYFMLIPLINHEPGEHTVSGWPLALVIGGILLPFAVKGRLGLEIRTLDRTFRWKPPLVVDKASKQNIEAFFDEIIVACEEAGFNTARA